LELPFTSAEAADLESFGRHHAGSAAIVPLAGFLKKRFGIHLETDPDIVVGFTTDSSNLKGSAQGLCRPASTRELALILRSTFVARIPVTISGGKSNLTGSATPVDGLVISLVNMLNPPAAIDVIHRQVRTPVGPILENLRQEVVKQTASALIYPVDPTSRSDATVGGTIACNASGFVPGDKGATRDWVQAIEALLPDGRLIRAERGQYVSRDGAFLLGATADAPLWPVPRYPRPAIKNAGGPYSAPNGVMDLLDLLIGSEGLFGVVTAATLRLAPRPEALLDIFFSLPGEREALAFYRYLARRLDGGLGNLGALEYFGVNCRRHMDHESVFFKGDHQVGLYVQAPVSGRLFDEAAEEWLGILAEADCGIEESSVMLLDDERSWKLFMEARHSLPANALEVVQHHGTFTIMTDTVVPPDRFPEFLDHTHGLLRTEGLDYVSFGHFGDCHLHFTILPEKKNLDKALDAYDRIVTKSAELGGVYSGEHGTGKRKRKDFLRCYGSEAVDDVVRCKRAVDPFFLLNRDNVVECPPEIRE
jgi:D-lactate dehydrogenase (cytochrome)